MQCSLPLLCIHWSKQLYPGSQPAVLVSSSYHQSLHGMALVGRGSCRHALCELPPLVRQIQLQPARAKAISSTGGSSGETYVRKLCCSCDKMWEKDQIARPVKKEEEVLQVLEQRLPNSLGRRLWQSRLCLEAQGESQWSRYPPWKLWRIQCHRR